MNQNFPKGVLTGSQVQELFQFAKQKSFALPAVNVVGSNSPMLSLRRQPN